MTNIQGLIFDFDGTLVDTMPLHWQAWQIITRHYQLDLPEDRFYSLGGVPSRDILRMLAREQGKSFDPLAVAHEKEEAYLQIMTQARPIQVVMDIVHANLGRLPLAVATGGSRRVIAKVLDHLRLAPYFKAVVTSDDVMRQKPAPDIFLEAARRIGIEPRHCRAYEDTELGLQAIRAAGMEAVDVRTLLSGQIAPY